MSIFRNINRYLGAVTFCLFKKFNLDIHITEHCNLNCKGCTHFSPIAEKEFIDLEIMEKSLMKLSKYNKIFKAIQLLGGEPLLNPDIVKIIPLVRKIFPNSNIIIFTNGLLLNSIDRQLPDFWSLVNEYNIGIKVTKYPINLNINLIKYICDKHKVKVEFCNNNDKHQWYSFKLKREKNNLIAFRYKWFKLFQCSTYHCIQLVGTNLYPCPHSAYMRHIKNRFNLNWTHYKEDYLDITKVNSAQEIRKFMIKAVPFCRHCGSRYKKSIWGKSEYSEDEWIE